MASVLDDDRKESLLCNALAEWFTSVGYTRHDPSSTNLWINSLPSIRVRFICRGVVSIMADLIHIGHDCTGSN